MLTLLESDWKSLAISVWVVWLYLAQGSGQTWSMEMGSDDQNVTFCWHVNDFFTTPSFRGSASSGFQTVVQVLLRDGISLPLL